MADDDRGARAGPDRETTAGTPAPPPEGSGIAVERTPAGTRITLPRLYTRGDVITTALAAAVAVWMAVWLDAMAVTGSGASALGRAVMAAIALAFAALALSQAFPMVTRRFVEARGDRLVLGRSLGARRFLRREIATADIRLVDRVRDAEPGAGEGPEELRVWAGDREYRLGRYLGEESLEWLEGAVRRVAGR